MIIHRVVKIYDKVMSAPVTHAVITGNIKSANLMSTELQLCNHFL